METSKAVQLKGNVEFLFRASEKSASHRILLTRAMIDGINPHLIQHQFPVMTQMVELVKKKKSEAENPTEYDAEILAAFFAGSVMGWFLYKPFLLASTGLDKRDKSEIESQIVQILEEMTERLC